jgi:hypothetical protein
MPLYFPDDCLPKQTPLSNVAREIAGQVMQMAVQMDMAVAGTLADAKNLGQFKLHCQRYLNALAPFPVIEGTRLAVPLKMCLEASGFGLWASVAEMEADLRALATAAGAARDWIAANVPEADEFEVTRLSPGGHEMVGEARKFEKRPEIVGELQKVLAIYTRPKQEPGETGIAGR